MQAWINVGSISVENLHKIVYHREINNRKEVSHVKLNQCINYLLTTAQHTVFQTMSTNLSQFDLTPVQYGVLYCLWEMDKPNPKEIAEELRLENSTISGILERMEKKELIVRNISPEDRRFIQIELTEKAKALRDDVLQTVENVNQEVLSVFPKEEQEQFKTYLRVLAGVPEV